jgi:hypothetical protein
MSAVGSTHLVLALIICQQKTMKTIIGYKHGARDRAH